MLRNDVRILWIYNASEKYTFFFIYIYASRRNNCRIHEKIPNCQTLRRDLEFTYKKFSQSNRRAVHFGNVQGYNLNKNI